MAQVCPGAVFLDFARAVRFDRVLGVLWNKATLCPYAARKTQGLARALPLDPWREEAWLAVVSFRSVWMMLNMTCSLRRARRLAECPGCFGTISARSAFGTAIRNSSASSC